MGEGAAAQMHAMLRCTHLSRARSRDFHGRRTVQACDPFATPLLRGGTCLAMSSSPRSAGGKYPLNPTSILATASTDRLGFTPRARLCAAKGDGPVRRKCRLRSQCGRTGNLAMCARRSAAQMSAAGRNQNQTAIVLSVKTGYKLLARTRERPREGSILTSPAIGDDEE